MTMVEARRDVARAKRLKDEGDALGDLVALIERVVGAADVVGRELDAMRAARDEALAEAECARSEAKDEIAQLEGDLRDAEDRVAEIFDRIDDLVRARAMLRAGDVSEAAYLIERALDHLDPAWRTRG